MKALAIIPARGGSKGIPRKNVIPLCGKPLIAWTIEAAQQAQHVSDVVVSTDHAEIAEVAGRYGAEVVWRPDQISGDHASSESALLHVLDAMEANGRSLPDKIVFPQCTSPLTTRDDIDGTIEALDVADTSLAVTDFHYFLWKQHSAQNFVGINHEKSVRPLRQDRQPQYLETGAVYAMHTAGFRQYGHRFFGTTAAYFMPAERCCEIDDPVDLEIAEVLLRRALDQRKSQLLPDPVEAFVSDFDGVFTDNRALILQDGREAVLCNRSDGMAVAQLRTAGIPVLVLSGEVNPVVARRCEKLGVECLHGIHDKWPVLRDWLAERRISTRNTVYLGNDLNDLDCLNNVGCGIVVSDAHPDVRSFARIRLTSMGGHGAIRELARLILEPRAGNQRAATA